MTLALPAVAAAWRQTVRSLAVALGLAAAEVGEGSVAMRLDALPAPRLVALTGGARTGRTDSPGIAVARRIAQAAGTAVDLRPEGAGMALSVLLPARADPGREARRA
jgi:hypothetical protein